MNNEMKLTFTENEIQRLFGHEAAEDEDPVRLREYYFKSDTYDQIATDLSLRLLVGHKGIGKSALFQVLMAENAEANILTVSIKPDDIVGLATDTSDFLQTIREWKNGLIEIIAKKILSSFGANDEKLYARLANYGGQVVEFVKDTFEAKSGLSLTPAKQKLIDHFLKNSNIYVYIDDLDRGWQGRKEDVTRISALLNAVRDISKESRGIKFRVGLRSDVYYLVRTSDESTDKIEGSVVWHTWTNHEILVLLVKRIESFFGRDVDEAKLLKTSQWKLASYLNPVMEARYSGQGHWENAPIYRVLMSLTRKRPRDLVKLCSLSAKRTRKRKGNLIRTDDFKDSFEEYSQGRLQDTINEFRSELPDIERLLLGMRPSKKGKKTSEGYTYSTDALLKKIKDIQEQGRFFFESKKEATAKELAGFMYKINFITARKEQPEGIVRKYFEESRFLQNQFADFGFAWEVHPAFRWALQPENIRDIFSSLELSADEK